MVEISYVWLGKPQRIACIEGKGRLFRQSIYTTKLLQCWSETGFRFSNISRIADIFFIHAAYLLVVVLLVAYLPDMTSTCVQITLARTNVIRPHNDIWHGSGWWLVRLASIWGGVSVQIISSKLSSKPKNVIQISTYGAIIHIHCIMGIRFILFDPQPLLDRRSFRSREKVVCLPTKCLESF